MPSRGPVRYAVVGLGHIAQVAVLPAFAHARRNSRLVARRERRRGQAAGGRPPLPPRPDLRTTTTTRPASSRSTPSTSRCPTRMHAEYTIRAARAGVHVLCEKPMAVTADECERMIDACRRAPRQADDRLPPALRGDQPEGDRPRAAGQDRRAEVLQLVVLDDRAARRHPHEEGLRRRLALRHRRLLHQRRALPVPRRAEGGRGRSRSTAASGRSPRSTSRRRRSCASTASASRRSSPASTPATSPSYRIVGTKGDIHVDPAYEYAEGLGYTLTVDGKTQRKTHRQARSVRAASCCTSPTASCAIARPSRPARKACRTCASCRRSTSRPRSAGRSRSRRSGRRGGRAGGSASPGPACGNPRWSRCRARAWTDVHGQHPGDSEWRLSWRRSTSWSMTSTPR